MNLAEYRKLIAAVVGLGLMIAHRHGLDLTGQEAAFVDIFLALGTAYGVYQVPNKQRKKAS